jgi:hypothetical protein
MNAPDAIFESRARRAYEFGRLGAGARRAAPLLIPIALALLGCGSPREVLACGGALLIAVTLFLWRGQDFEAGVGPGVAAGLAPLLLPVLTRGAGHLCSPGVCLLLPAVCALGGLLGGCLLGLLAPPPRVGRMVPFAVACTVAALTGAVGCLLYGLVGLLVMGAGLAAGVAPLVAARHT